MSIIMPSTDNDKVSHTGPYSLRPKCGHGVPGDPGHRSDGGHDGMFRPEGHRLRRLMPDRSAWRNLLHTGSGKTIFSKGLMLLSKDCTRNKDGEYKNERFLHDFNSFLQIYHKSI